MKTSWQVDQRVHVDADTKDWGRVCSDATVIQVNKFTLLVSADTIRAYIVVRKSEAKPL